MAKRVAQINICVSNIPRLLQTLWLPLFLRNWKDSIYSVPCNECNKEYIDQTFSENDNLHGEIIKLLPSFRSSIKDVVWRLGMSIGYMFPFNRNNGGILPEANFGL